MDVIADILLAAGAFGAAFYCVILGRRLRKFNDLEKGVGGAVTVLSSQVDDLTEMLSVAQKTAARSADMLTALVERAEETSRQLELQMASLHDVTERQDKAEPAPDVPCEAPQAPVPDTIFVRHAGVER